MWYSPESTYEATNFHNEVAIEELKGKLMVGNKQLVSCNNYYRLITQKGTWTQKGPSKAEVRKIK